VDRCHGKTKAGERCKRSVPDGDEYCSVHAAQAAAAPDSATASDETGLLDTLFVLAAAGAILSVGLILRRTFRLL